MKKVEQATLDKIPFQVNKETGEVYFKGKREDIEKAFLAMS